ncbi:two-component system sensor histidine kinase [Natrinema mahii]|nr:two-component system sensor histidine kinase [Natrinema mahii]
MLLTSLVLWGCVAGAVLSLGIVVYTRDQTDEPAVSEFQQYMLVVSLWATMQVLMLLDAPPGALFWDTVREFGAGAAAVTFVVFVARYTQSNWLNRTGVVRGMWLVLGVASVLSVTAPYHGLVPTAAVETYHGVTVVSRPPEGLWAFYIVYVYLLLAAAIGSLGRFMFASANIFRRQTAVILTGGILVSLGTIAFVTRPAPILDAGPALQSLQGLLIVLSIYRYDFLTIMPLARDTIIDTVEDPILVLDNDDTIAYANSAATDIGIDSDDLSRSIEDIVPNLNDALSSEHGILEYSPTPVTDGGEPLESADRWFSLSVTPIVDQHDIERGRVVVCADITEQKQREQRLDQFANIVSHDLRNPLNVASGHLEIQRQKEDSDSLRQVSRAHDRMEQLIEELLSLARHGYDDADPEPVELAAMATAAWDGVSTGDSTLRLDVADEVSISADTAQVQTILENLFRNADEHNESPVEVRVGTTDAGFFVADDGSGIPPEKRDEIFEEGVTSNVDGTGYGLHIVEQFASAHGWEVTVTESETGGARFEFSSVLFVSPSSR